MKKETKKAKANKGAKTSGAKNTTATTETVSKVAIIENTTETENTEKKIVSVTDKVSAIVALVKRELLTNRSVVAALYDNRNNETLTEIASVLFADVTESTTRKVAITAALKRYINLMPIKIVVRYNETSYDYKAAKMQEIVDGVFRAVEIDAIDTLEAVLYNYYNGGKSVCVESNMYYNAEMQVVDKETAKAKINAAKEAAKEKRAESTEKRDKKAIDNADVLTLLNAALQKATDNATKAAILAAIKTL